MKEYIGKICPYCKTEFVETDEIVVCNSCEMPHHKNCWIENKGCTTFGCLGTIDTPKGETTVTQNQTKYEETDIIYCSKCGAKNKQADSFCSKCGNALHINTNQANTSNNANYNVGQTNANYNTNYNTAQTNTNYNTNYSNTNIDPEMQKFIGENAQYYIPKFEEIKRENKQITWNWSAFLFTAYWLIYRKMYAYGLAVIGISFVIGLIAGAFSFILGLALDIAVGLYANYMYMKQIEKHIYQSKSINEPYKSQYIAKNAGVNASMTIAAVVGYVIIYAIVMNM